MTRAWVWGTGKNELVAVETLSRVFAGVVDDHNLNRLASTANINTARPGEGTRAVKLR